MFGIPRMLRDIRTVWFVAPAMSLSIEAFWSRTVAGEPERPWEGSRIHITSILEEEGVLKAGADWRDVYGGFIENLIPA